MKCMFIRQVDVDTTTMSEAQKKLVKVRMNKVNGVLQPIPIFEVGTVYEFPDAPIHCRNGHAAPLDDECTKATGMTDKELAAARHIQKRAAAGIRPEDYPLFDAGVITGYVFETGDYVPGPNWEAWKKAQEAEASQPTSGTDI